MARIRLPLLTPEASAYVNAILGRATEDFDPTILNDEQLEQLHAVLGAELEAVREKQEPDGASVGVLTDAVARIARQLERPQSWRAS